MRGKGKFFFVWRSTSIDKKLKGGKEGRKTGGRKDGQREAKGLSRDND